MFDVYVNYLIKYPLPLMATFSLLPLIFIITYRKYYKVEYVLWFLIYLIVKFYLEIERSNLAAHRENSLLIHNLIIWFNLLFIILMFLKTEHYKKYKWILISIFIIFTIEYGWDVFETNRSFDVYNFRALKYSYTFYHTIVIFLICSYFYLLVTNPTIPDLFKFPLFYICSGLLLVSSGCVFLSILYYYSFRWGNKDEWILYLPYIFEIISSIFIYAGFYNRGRNLETN